MTIIPASESSRRYHEPSFQAWTFQAGKLYPVSYFNPTRGNGKLVCNFEPGNNRGTITFDVDADSPCYVFASDTERREVEEALQQIQQQRQTVPVTPGDQ